MPVLPLQCNLSFFCPLGLFLDISRFFISFYLALFYGQFWLNKANMLVNVMLYQIEIYSGGLVK